MFQFPTFPSYTLLYSCMDRLTFPQPEFPHSDIHGSQDICSLPWLFAAYHVLLRLLVPRHSPYALSSLTYFLLVQLFSSFLLFLGSSSLPFFIFNYSIYFSMCYSNTSFKRYSLVGSNGIEPSTSRLSGVRSNHLSYEPVLELSLLLVPFVSHTLKICTLIYKVH